MKTPIDVVVADITSLRVDALVNAANPSLLGGGGVDGAIHRAAGPALRDACAGLNGCETGDAKLTPGFALPAHHVIHTVGPIWYGGARDEARLLASCYRRAVELAVAAGDRSIAFPSISTGAYGYPVRLAAPTAVGALRDALAANSMIRLVVMCCFSVTDAVTYLEALSNR